MRSWRWLATCCALVAAPLALADAAAPTRALADACADALATAAAHAASCRELDQLHPAGVTPSALGATRLRDYAPKLLRQAGREHNPDPARAGPVIAKLTHKTGPAPGFWERLWLALQSLLLKADSAQPQPPHWLKALTRWLGGLSPGVGTGAAFLTLGLMLLMIVALLVYLLRKISWRGIAKRSARMAAEPLLISASMPSLASPLGILPQLLQRLRRAQLIPDDEAMTNRELADCLGPGERQVFLSMLSILEPVLYGTAQLSETERAHAEVLAAKLLAPTP